MLLHYLGNEGWNRVPTTHFSRQAHLSNIRQKSPPDNGLFLFGADDKRFRQPLFTFSRRIQRHCQGKFNKKFTKNVVKGMP
jgi:hypothetical protein